ncbi:hypothetical protein ABW21_db0202619 [Orbilia brochopaga]|nr:hypothetical protein ABW21_db0202619 [Drechslerella brochopaga]
MRFLNLAGYTDQDGKYFYPTCAYTCLNDMPDQICSPSQSCLCMNTRLLDELGVCVKLECVHGGDMSKFWRVMGREYEDIQGVGVEDLVVPEPEPEPPEAADELSEEDDPYESSDYGDHFRYFKQREKEEREWEKECRRRDMALLAVPRPKSPAPTQLSEGPALTITVTKTVSIEVESLRTMNTIDCRTVRNMCLENGEVGSSSVWDKSFFRAEDEESERGWEFDGRSRSRSKRRPSHSRPGTARPNTARNRLRSTTPAPEPLKEPELQVNVPCHEVVDFLRKVGMTPKKVAGMVKKVKNVFGRTTTA